MNRAEILEQIDVRLEDLSKTDYQAIKYAEGCLTYEEYASMRTQRQSWRTEINELEAQIASLEV